VFVVFDCTIDGLLAKTKRELKFLDKLGVDDGLLVMVIEVHCLWLV
jgi:hypothetical protein